MYSRRCGVANPGVIGLEGLFLVAKATSMAFSEKNAMCKLARGIKGCGRTGLLEQDRFSIKQRSIRDINFYQI